MNLPVSSRLAAAFLGFAAALLAAGPASAQTLTWGPGGAGGSGQWDAGTTVDWYNGTANVPWTNGASAVFGGAAGTVSISGSVTASQLTFNTAGYVVQNSFLVGTSGGLTIQTNADATLTGAVFGASPYSTPFTKSGTAVLTLNNNGGGPVFFGSVTVADGELRYADVFGPNATTPYVLGNTSAAALTFASTTATVGSLAGGGTTGGVVRPNATSGAFTLIFNGSADATYAGTFAGNGNATLALRKNGAATQTLTNASYALTGAVTVNAGRLVLSGANGALPNISGLTVNSGGTFQLDNGGSVNQTRLSTSLPVTLNGGTLSLTGNAASQDVHQSVGALNLGSGASAVSVASTGNGVAQLIFSGAPARTNAATVGYSDGGRITLTGASNVNGILPAYQTVGANWAAVDANGNVSAFAGYTTDTTTANTPDNLRVTSGGGSTVSLAAVQGRNSLNVVSTADTNGTVTVDLGANGSLTLASGGLLTSGGGRTVIQNGKIAGGTNELIVNDQSALTISCPINSAVTKTGAGTLVLAGSNTYTGATTVNQGIVQVAADANLGIGNTVAVNGGTLQATAGFTSTKSVQGNGGTLDTNGNTVAFTGGVNTGSFNKTGAGTLSLTGQVGAITVSGGTLQLTNLTGTTSSSVTLLNGRLEADVNGLNSVTSFGGTGVVLSPGARGQAVSLPINFLTVLSPTTVDFDLGSAGGDRLTIAGSLSLGGNTPGLLFRFNDLGGTQTGVAYPLLRLPSSQAASTSLAGFGIDSVSVAAGYRGAFSLSSGQVFITFSAVPEPSTVAVMLVGAVAAWFGARRRLART